MGFMSGRKTQVGELRPSQVLTTFGIGSVVDLPYLSAMVMGLEDWPISYSAEIPEERLLQSVKGMLGPQVVALRTPPRADPPAGPSNWFDPLNHIGVPVAPFPRWLVCSKCRLLAPISSGLFEDKVEAYRPDQTRYVHNCQTRGRPPIALPARFLVACKKGHLDDFPWLEFAHDGHAGCAGPLELNEVGPSGEAADVLLVCRACGKKKTMAQAFGRENLAVMPACRGRRPHLRDVDPKGCDEANVSPILLGASNSWFPIIISVLSVPKGGDRLSQLVDDNWAVLGKATSPEVLTGFRAINRLPDLAEYTDRQVWAAVERKRSESEEQDDDPTDLKSPEWAVLSQPGSVQESRDFRLRQVPPPAGYERYFDKVVLAERLREVRAMVGFTRIESSRDFETPFDIPKEQIARLSRQRPQWVPAAETRGEGVFIQFSERMVADWVSRVSARDADFLAAHRQWRSMHGLEPAEEGYPGIRYILLHSFAHALLRQLTVECGYTAASVSERIYCDGADGEAKAGVLIYTSASDSEGTLGGLCSLGEPGKLGRHLDQALARARLCASDPLCAEHELAGGRSLHGAACHACSFLPETSCERGNKYLDRAVLVETVERSDCAFFG